MIVYPDDERIDVLEKNEDLKMKLIEGYGQYEVSKEGIRDVIKALKNKN